MKPFPFFFPPAVDALADLVLQEAVLPIAQQWKKGQIRTLQEMNEHISAQVNATLNSTLAQDVLGPVIQPWLTALEQKLQAIIEPICDRYEVPRREMQLHLTAGHAGSIAVKTSAWMGLSVAGSIMGAVISVIASVLCGGGGIAVISSGPLGLLGGLVIGVIASVLGWNVVSEAIMKADIPVFMRLIPLGKTLNSEKTRRELKNQLLQNLSQDNSDFQRQLVEDFSKALRGHIYTIAQAAEIPIE